MCLTWWISSYEEIRDNGKENVNHLTYAVIISLLLCSFPKMELPTKKLICLRGEALYFEI